MADSIPVILSKARPDRPDRARMDAQLVEGLSGRPGVELHVLPHVYDLAPDGPGVEFLRPISGPMIVLAWLYPRSTFWVLDAHGVRGRLGQAASLAGDEPEPPPQAKAPNAPDGPDRTIWCVDLRAHDRAEPCLDEIGRIVDAALEPAAPEGLPAGALPDLIDEATRPRWYPVVDYGRCTNCLECLNFCIFGVYGLDASERIVAEEPDACRPGCPACARICPAGAIMFPEYHAVAAAAGADTGEIPPFRSDALDPEALSAACAAARRRLRECGCHEGEAPAAELDRALDQLADEDP